MATTPGKYRLGAPSSITLDANTAAPIDLGSSMGGVTFNYKPSYFQAKPDQVIGSVAVWRTQEEGTIEMTLPELSVTKLLAAFSYATTGVTTVASGTLGAISGFATGNLSTFGAAGAATVSYQAFAYDSNGDGIPSTAATISTANAALTATNGINITPPTLPAGAVGWGLIRSAGGPSQGLIGRFLNSTATVQDTGLAATAYTNAVAQPATPNTDTAFVGNSVGVPIHQLDIVVPKNVVGSTLNWRWTFWKAFAEGQPSIDWKRDKNSEYKVQLGLLMDTTQTAGQQLYKMVEEY